MQTSAPFFVRYEQTFKFLCIVDDMQGKKHSFLYYLCLSLILTMQGYPKTDVDALESFVINSKALARGAK